MASNGKTFQLAIFYPDSKRRFILGRNEGQYKRIESTEELLKELEPWYEERNERGIGVNWRFTTANARIKLRRLYPAVQNS